MNIHSGRNSMLRTFIAVKIPQMPELRRLHSQLADLGDRFRPVSLSNLHVTLKFLGDVAESQISAIAAAVERVVNARPKFVVRLIGLGAFPSDRRPSVVWAGFKQAAPLCQMATELDGALVPLGFAPEVRQFQPHLTLLRVKSRPPEALFGLLTAEAETDFGMIEISHVELVESELTRGGSRYTTLAKCALSASD
jgi:2'-5' RNA ligase